MHQEARTLALKKARTYVAGDAMYNSSRNGNYSLYFS